jgi:hypothetical protein
MIRQMLDRKFFLRHLDAFGPHLDREIELHRNGDPGSHALIDCQNDHMKVQYMNEDGTPHNFDDFR